MFARIASRSSVLVRHSAQRFSRSPSPIYSTLSSVNFHSSAKREDKKETAIVPIEPEKSLWDPMYGPGIGIMLAVPALYFELYLITEETLMAGAFVFFCALVHKNFGGMLYDLLTADGIRELQVQNEVEDAAMLSLQSTLDSVRVQENILNDAQDVFDLKMATYAKLNAAGKNKPLFEYKAQMERLLSMIAHEEAGIRERAKHALMKEATDAVTKEFSSSADLKKNSLSNAIAILQGKSTSTDTVKDAYLRFFKNKASQSESLDEQKEINDARNAVVTKLNTVAKTDNFYFYFDKSGQLKMAA